METRGQRVGGGFPGYNGPALPRAMRSSRVQSLHPSTPFVPSWAFVDLDRSGPVGNIMFFCVYVTRLRFKLQLGCGGKAMPSW
jgi:hypothetical protein